MLYQYIFGREPGPLGFLDKKGHDDMYYVHRDTAKLHLLNRPHETYTLTTPEGLKLKGFYYPAGDRPSGKIAFIVHGYRSTGAEAAGVFQEFYHSRGIDIFAPDNPAAGESEGDFISFDYYESRAALLWIEFLLMRFGEDIELLLHGFSLGGGAVLAMSDRVPENVRFIVDDSGFTGAEEMLRRKFGPLYFAINGTVLAKNRLRFSLGMTDVTPHLKNAKCPILFVHGKEDPTVPFAMSPKLSRLCPTYRETLFTEGTKHVETIHTCREQYEAKLDRFLDFYF